MREFDCAFEGDEDAEIGELVELLEARVRTALHAKDPGTQARVFTFLMEMCTEGLNGRPLAPQRQIELLRMHLDPHEVPDAALLEVGASTQNLEPDPIVEGLRPRTEDAVSPELIARTVRLCLSQLEEDDAVVPDRIVDSPAN